MTSFGRSYRFAGQEGCFVPYALENEGHCWGTNAVCTWKIAGLPDTLKGDKVSVTLLTSRMPIRVESILTAATGETLAYPFDITYDGPVCTEEYVTTTSAELKMPMMVITTSISINVNPRFWHDVCVRFSRAARQS